MKSLTATQRDALLKTLKSRFDSNMTRHESVDWKTVQSRLESNPVALRALNSMEESGGEPDVVGIDKQTGEIIFFDCSPQTPEGRRNVCYDQEALDARKQHKPKNSAVAMATAMGVELLSTDEYQNLQKLGEFDTKTSSWVKTPDRIRNLGGALFCDRRFDTVFIYHNGAESYYGGRGFRCSLKV